MQKAFLRFGGQQSRARRIVVATVGMAAAMLIAHSTSYAQGKDWTEGDRQRAENLHILFSEVAANYPCRTPQADQAYWKIYDEIGVVGDVIEQITYSVSFVGGGRTRKPTTGKEAEVASLERIRDRLYQNLDKLARLKPCDITRIPYFSNGIMLGISLIKSTGGIFISERFVPNGQITNTFNDSHDPVGFGVSFAYGFTPWSNSVVVAPFVSFDYPNISVFHTFPGGSYLGTTSNFSATAGVKIGPAVGSNLWLYGIAGVSALNETMKINFIPAFSSSDTTVAGATVGAGFALHPRSWQIANHPISLFAEYQHTWWDDAHFNAPSASPAFNYTFRRQDDVVKLGINISFAGAPPPPLAPSYPVKALPAK